MERLLIQFRDDEIADFRWARHDDAARSVQPAWHDALADELSQVASQNPLPTIIFIPQQCVYLTAVELPEKAGRQVLSAIEFQVEDQLAQDIETQHFALGDTHENPISIAVVSRDIMERCLRLAQQQGLRLTQILPELFLCPWSQEEGGVSLIEGYDGCLLRYGDYRGLKCNAVALPAMLELVQRDVEFGRIRYFPLGEEPTPDIAGVEVLRMDTHGNAPAYIDTPVIDLQQRDFKLSSAWIGLARVWRWAAVLLVALLVIGGYNRAVALFELESELAELRQQQFELARPWLPPDTRPDANVKTLLITRLQELQASQGQRGFLALMLEFANLRNRYPEVDISRIGYQGAQLNIDLESKVLADVEALHKALVDKGIDARLQDLNIKPELISGRLVLRGGGDA